jgi:hypothetical protein
MPTTKSQIIARVGHANGRTERLALLHPDGKLSNYLARDWTRTEIAEWLATKGMTLHADDTVTREQV